MDKIIGGSLNLLNLFIFLGGFKVKTLYALLVCALLLPLLLLGCGTTQKSSNLMAPTGSGQGLPSDDDIQGLYDLAVPENWEQTEDSVVYVKYFRVQLLRQFGNRPEIHIVADMELKKRQQVYPTPDEYIAYLEAHYRLFQDKETLEELEAYRKKTATQQSTRKTFDLRFCSVQ